MTRSTAMPATPDLFPTEADAPAPVAAAADGLFAQVVFNRPLTQFFTYLVPPEMAAHAAPGKRVAVPFGRGDKMAIGYVAALTPQAPARAVKAVRRFLDDEPLLTDP